MLWEGGLLAKRVIVLSGVDVVDKVGWHEYGKEAPSINSVPHVDGAWMRSNWINGATELSCLVLRVSN